MQKKFNKNRLDIITIDEIKVLRKYANRVYIIYNNNFIIYIHLCQIFNKK